MASPNAFLASLEKEIAIAIQADAQSRIRIQRHGSGADEASLQQSYSTDELAELIYFGAQSAAQTFQQDLSREKSRLSLGMLVEQPANPGVTTDTVPLAPADLIGQITAVLQFHNWVRSTDPRTTPNYAEPSHPDIDPISHQPNGQILINQLYQEESRSFQLQNQLTQDKLVQQRKQTLQENFRRFYNQLPAQAKNQLLANIPAEIVLKTAVQTKRAS
jgi:hypothetical protein